MAEYTCNGTTVEGHLGRPDRQTTSGWWSNSIRRSLISLLCIDAGHPFSSLYTRDWSLLMLSLGIPTSFAVFPSYSLSQHPSSDFIITWPTDRPGTIVILMIASWPLCLKEPKGDNAKIPSIWSCYGHVDKRPLRLHWRPQQQGSILRTWCTSGGWGKGFQVYASALIAYRHAN